MLTFNYPRSISDEMRKRKQFCHQTNGRFNRRRASQESERDSVADVLSAAFVNRAMGQLPTRFQIGNPINQTGMTIGPNSN
jgi:hypothetical protein